MDEPWPGLSSARSGCRGRERTGITARLQGTVQSPRPGPRTEARSPAWNHRCNGERRRKSGYEHSYSLTNVAPGKTDMGYGVDAEQVEKPFDTSMPLEALIGPYPDVWPGYAGSLRG
ncbi:uncharacterized protein Triagg1_9646 [Trichoderma aggressivum f. europaeum]|uniref:Uncharacterized protein n=1 Tax=Trichoderma aggressivum f. europaeum TaxID=173218 RepID=A0AAE1I6U1_9HYPO|nr:hypothetical protein Triagg1_9646 [Trichoderma aggressivum f. europaeum]